MWGHIHLQGEYKMIDILSQEERRMLTDFFELLNINMNKKQFYSFKKYKGKERFCTSEKCISHIYNNYLPNSRLFHNARNCYFYINEGKTIAKLKTRWKLGEAITKQIESRKAVDRIAFNAFYFDFDIKDSQSQHLPLQQLQQEKAKLLPLLKNVPHTAIVESYNGFHLYLAIHPKDRHMKESMWRDIESQLLHYLFHNVSDYIDTSVKDPARILRIPSTYHKKSDSELFKVQIVDLVHKQFTIEEVKRLFTLDFSNTFIPEKKKVTMNNTHQLSTSNEVIEAIENQDISFFRSYIPLTSTYKTTKERIDYIKSFDMLYFLRIDELTQDRFSSIIREDKHPSAFIDIVKHNGKPVYLYNDLGLHNFSKDLIELVKYIANISNKQALKFLCDIFFSNNSITHHQQKHIDDFINDNINVLISFSKKKQFRFLKRIIPLYKAISSMLKIRLINSKVPIEKYRLKVASDYISSNYDIPKSTVSKGLLIFTFLGIVKQVESDSFIIGKSSTKTIVFHDITLQKRHDFIYKSLIALTLKYSNVLRDIRKKDLHSIEVYW